MRRGDLPAGDGDGESDMDDARTGDLSVAFADDLRIGDGDGNDAAAEGFRIGDGDFIGDAGGLEEDPAAAAGDLGGSAGDFLTTSDFAGDGAGDDALDEDADPPDVWRRIGEVRKVSLA